VADEESFLLSEAIGASATAPVAVEESSFTDTQVETSFLAGAIGASAPVVVIEESSSSIAPLAVVELICCQEPTIVSFGAPVAIVIHTYNTDIQSLHQLQTN